VERVRDFETGLYEFLDKSYADLMHDLKAKYELTDPIEAKLKTAIADWKTQFMAKSGSDKK
jgi:F0F1-type ATP synthase alpha subunit